MTGMYNVLEKLRSGEELTAKERKIHEDGLVSVLKQIHDDLDAAVFDAYGWPHDLTDEQILERLVALNHERAEEEKRGIIRWLRPEFQNPSGAANVQPNLPAAEAEDEDDDAPKKKPPKAVKEAWPATLPERIKGVRAALAAHGKPLVAAELAGRFKRAKAADVQELLETLVAVGQARVTDDGRFTAA